VRNTAISFETEPTTVEPMRSRIASALERHCWLVSEDEEGGSMAMSTQNRFRDRWWQLELREPTALP
jgi:hypothetical protein